MCEPHHSINQVDPRDPETGDPINVDGIFGTIGEWMRKVGSFFHFSKLGNGHSEAIKFAVNHYGRVPEPTRYEAKWWDRTVHLDGSFYNRSGWYLPDEVYRKESLECAEAYARQVCIGDLSMLRRFLETSIKKSDHAEIYFHVFRDHMLTDKGKNIFDQKRKIINGLSIPHSVYNERMTKATIGLTRKRDLLVPEWADDKKLWTPA